MGSTEQDRRLPTGERLYDLTYEQVWLDAQYESILTGADRQAWQRHEASKPENVEWRRRKLAEHDARESESVLEVVSHTVIADEYGTHEMTVRRLPGGRRASQDAQAHAVSGGAARGGPATSRAGEGARGQHVDALALAERPERAVVGSDA